MLTVVPVAAVVLPMVVTEGQIQVDALIQPLIVNRNIITTPGEIRLVKPRIRLSQRQPDQQPHHGITLIPATRVIPDRPGKANSVQLLLTRLHEAPMQAEVQHLPVEAVRADQDHAAGISSIYLNTETKGLR